MTNGELINELKMLPKDDVVAIGFRDDENVTDIEYDFFVDAVTPKDPEGTKEYDSMTVLVIDEK